MTRVKRDLTDALPRYYDDSPEVEAIMSANAEQVDKTRIKARATTDQFYVGTATNGLDDWERVLDLPPRPNSSLEFRRNRILARLNGTAPATVAYLTDVVNAYVADKSARIIEYNGEYRFEAEIPLSENISFNTSEIQEAVNEVKPAHLAFDLVGSIREGIVLTESAYTFEVPYRICDTFRTDDAQGIADRVEAKLGVQEYNFAVNYPICGEFYASETEAI
ncbi:putative phage tail protein [Cytobacillus massiliigabonensis]|uniref:putative phage tail protein n=1 Tax=Cytobacillus massiliigabonensis TaxID=1871011 RepID=UPI000C83FE90|nr:putative phage tail protein [Cytobacillus massiliigabonensis]